MLRRHVGRRRCSRGNCCLSRGCREGGPSGSRRVAAANHVPWANVVMAGVEIQERCRLGVIDAREEIQCASSRGVESAKRQIL